MAMIDISVPDPLKTAFLDCSDLGNARRLVIVSAGRLLWVEDAMGGHGAWAAYDAVRWSIEHGGMEAQRIAHKVIEHIDAEAMALSDIADDPIALKRMVGDWCTVEMAQKRVDVLRGHAVKSGSAGMTSGMLKQARSFLSARLDQFDVDPLVYNCLNGTLRFLHAADGKWMVEQRPHDPEDRLMQVSNVEYDPNAEAPFWTSRLAMLTPDAEQLAAFRPLYGYTLTGLASDQSFYIHQGKGGDGKSMTHMALADLHGDYYRHAGIKTFLQGRDGGGQEHRSDLVRLAGDVRFVTSDEPKPHSVWDGEVMKQITGSLVTARGVNARTEITFAPRFKLFTECNVIPRAPSDDKGFRRRMKLFQWRVSLDDTPDGAMQPDLVLANLRAEKPGILNWLIAGCLEWLETRRIPQPTAMGDVLKDFWSDSSPLLEWMEEWCDTSDPQAFTYSRDLWNHFKEWCENAGREPKPATETAFGRALLNKQFKGDKDGKGKRFRWGIRLRAEGMFGAADPQPATSAGPGSPERKPDAGPASGSDGVKDDYVPY